MAYDPKKPMQWDNWPIWALHNPASGPPEAWAEARRMFKEGASIDDIAAHVHIFGPELYRRFIGNW